MSILACSILALGAIGTQLPHFEVTRDVRIGSVDGPNDALTEVRGIVVGANGLLYVSQPRESVIRVFDSRGRFVRLIGGPGEGPGEFRWPAPISWLGDSLVVMDRTLYRASLFSPVGDLLRTQRLTPRPLGPNLVANIPSAILSTGVGIVQGGYTLDAVFEGVVRDIPVARVTWSGDVLDTVAVLPVPPVFIIREGNSSYQGTQPFGPLAQLAVEPGGAYFYVVATSPPPRPGRSAVRVTKFAASGDTVYSRQFDYASVPIPDAVRDSVYGAITAAVSSPRARVLPEGAATRAVRAAVRVPPAYPAADSAIAGADQTLWLRIRRPDGTRSWHILDSTGRPTAEVFVPSNLSLRYVTSTTIWGVEHDALDVPYVVSYRLVRKQV